MIIAIDATNIGSGGGINHLKNYLINSLKFYSENRYIIFISNSSKIDKINNNNLTYKTLNFSTILFPFLFDQELLKLNCDLLFSPGGIFLGKFKPFVTMSQNMLPFSKSEIKRFDLKKRIKFILLKKLLVKSFNKSDGIIFLSDYAQKIIRQNISQKNQVIIPHGGGENSIMPQKPKNNKLKFLYVSDFWPYKNHEYIISLLLDYSKQRDIELHLVGFYTNKIKNRLDLKFSKDLDYNKNIFFHGFVNHNEIDKFYLDCDVVIFPSSCENLPIAIIEALSYSKPILTLDIEPMKKMIFSNGHYLKINNYQYSLNTLIKFCKSENLNYVSVKNAQLSKKYKWKSNAIETNNFFKKILNENTI